MSYKKDYYLRRVMLVQTYDAMYFEKGNQRKCHKSIWRKACALFYLSYSTYMHYLKKETSGVPPITDQEIDLMMDFAARLDANRRKIVRGELPEK